MNFALVWASLWSQKKLTIAILVALTLAIATQTGLCHFKATIHEATLSLSPPNRFRVDLYQDSNPNKQKRTVTPRYWKSLEDDLGSDWRVMAYQPMGLSVFYNGTRVDAEVIAIDPEWLAELSVVVNKGRLLEEDDAGQKVAIAGQRVALDLIENKSAVIWLNREFGTTLLGTLKEQKTEMGFDYDINRCIFVPIESLSRFRVKPAPSALWVAYPKAMTMKNAQKKLEAVLEARSYRAWIRDPEALSPHQALLNTATLGLSGLLSFSALGLLLYAFYQWFHQRQYELGLRLAVGASARDCAVFVGSHFMLLSGISALLGLGLGTAWAKWMAFQHSLPFTGSFLGFGVVLVPFLVSWVGAYATYKILLRKPVIQWL